MATLPGGQTVDGTGLTEDEQQEFTGALQGLASGGRNVSLVETGDGEPGGTLQDQLDTVQGGGDDDAVIVNVTPSAPAQGGDGSPTGPTSTFLGAGLRGVVVTEDDEGQGSQVNLFGNDDDNIFQTGTGADSLSGGAGEDTLFGGAGDDVIFDTSGASSISGGAGDDLLYAGDGDDTLSGGTGDDLIFGQQGADSIMGGAGNDSISGGAGSDSIWGGAGDDTLVGGADDDVFFFEGGFGSDTIQDFSGGDTIDLSGLGVDMDFINANTEFVDGDAVITFADGSMLTILNAGDSLDDDWFVV